MIDDAGQTLIDLLREELQGLVPRPEEEIALGSPAEAREHGSRLTLFLYSVVERVETDSLRNLVVNPTEARQAPLSVDLYYLLTAFPQGEDPLTDRTRQAHRILAAAMAVFHQHGILTGMQLRGRLPRDLELRVTRHPISVEDLTRVWSVFPETGYQPSAGYLVTPVPIDLGTLVESQRVVGREAEMDHAAPRREGSRT